MEKKLASGFREETASPTVLLESINLPFAIDAHEERDVMIADVSNALTKQAWTVAQSAKAKQ